LPEHAEFTEPPAISVIIPAYNAEGIIAEGLTALRNQTVPAAQYEVIVVDDGSEDRTVEVARQAGARVLAMPHQGPAAARNAGVRAAHGEIVLFTDADCVPAPDWIEEMVRPFREDPDVVGVKGRYKTRQRSIVARFAQIEFEDRYRRLERLQTIDFVDSHAAGFRKQTFLAMGGFDPNFPVANNEDVELSYKLARAGHKMVFAPRAVVYHRHPETLLRYLYVKLLRAYWRIMVYRKFPEKMVSDSYTPQTLKLQIVLAFLVLLGLPPAALDLRLAILPGAAAGAFLLSTLPFAAFAWRRDRGVALAAPAILFLRSIVFALGVVGGTLSHKRHDILIPLLLIIGDLTAAAAAFMVAYYFRTVVLHRFFPPFEHRLYVYLLLLPFMLAILLFVFSRRGLYQERRTGGDLGEIVPVSQAFSVVILTIVAVSFFLKWDFSRPLVVLYWLFGLIAVNIARALVRRLEQNMIRKGYKTLRVLLVGTGETAQMIVNKFAGNDDPRYRVVGVVEEPGVTPASLGDIPVLGTTEQLPELVREHNIEEVLFAKPGMPHEEILNLVVRCEDTGASFRIVSDLFGIFTQTAALDAAFDMPLVDLRGDPPGALRRLVKAVFDYTLAALLLVLLSPLLLLLALLIRLDTRGSALVTQQVVGQGGKEFRRFRFRTCKETPEGPRPTRLGAWLEQTGIDELPQLLNVLRGEMSLVGPRPELPEIVKGYARWQRKRLDVKPGITGLWQIYDARGEPLHHNLEHDFFYIKNQSLLLDLSILIKTIPAILLTRKQ
jgi:exopolysaccharide biosynthesis polyprenyl glycosylphosphotransferase